MKHRPYSSARAQKWNAETRAQKNSIYYGKHNENNKYLNDEDFRIEKMIKGKATIHVQASGRRRPRVIVTADSNPFFICGVAVAILSPLSLSMCALCCHSICFCAARCFGNLVCGLNIHSDKGKWVEQKMRSNKYTNRIHFPSHLIHIRCHCGKTKDSICPAYYPV